MFTRISLFHSWKKSWQNSSKVYVISALKPARTLFKYYGLDCTSKKVEQFAQKELRVESFPGLIVYAIGNKDIFIPKLHFFQLNNIVEVTKDVSDMLTDTTLSLRSDQVQSQVSETIMDGKIILILLHDSKDISMSYRALSKLSKYKSTVVFSNVKNPKADLTQAFGISGLPALVAVFSNSPKKTMGEGDVPKNVQLARFREKYLYDTLETFIDLVTISDFNDHLLTV